MAHPGPFLDLPVLQVTEVTISGSTGYSGYLGSDMSCRCYPSRIYTLTEIDTVWENAREMLCWHKFNLTYGFKDQFFVT